jgi:outer membrane protein OmpA-like peptidoglycan-associated protein
MSYGVTYAQLFSWKKAQKFAREKEYEKAIELYEKDMKGKDNVKSTMGIADCHRSMGNIAKAELWYEKVLGFDKPDPMAYIYMAEIKIGYSEYVEARRHLKKYEELVEDRRTPILEKLIAICDSGYYWIQEPLPGRIKNEESLNSSKNDWGTTFYKEGIAFCTNRKVDIKTPYEEDERGLQRVVSAEYDLEARGFKNLEGFGRPINSTYNSGPISFYRDGKNAIMARTLPDPINKEGKKLKTHKNPNLFLLDMNEDSTYTVTPFAYNSEMHHGTDGPFLAGNDQILYFSSNIPGGFGGYDLYYSERNPDGTWRQPYNCGPQINTAGDEKYPVFIEDGTMYFASNGHPGMGGLDIFIAKGSLSSWDNIQNIGYPINSGANDFYFRPLGNGICLLSSDRRGGHGGIDIYSFTYDRTGYRPVRTHSIESALREATGSEATTVAEGNESQEEEQTKPHNSRVAKESEQKRPEGEGISAPLVVPVTPAATLSSPGNVTSSSQATATQEDIAPEVSVVQTPTEIVRISIQTRSRNGAGLPNTKMILKDNSSGDAWEFFTDDEGNLDMDIWMGVPYTLTAEKSSYTQECISFTINSQSKSGKIIARITLGQQYMNRDIRIPNLFFNPNAWTVKSTAEKELDKLVKLLTENPKLSIEIKSYANDASSFDENILLSQRRARSIYNYLAYKGVEESRIYTNGYGPFVIANSDVPQPNYRVTYRLFETE